MKNADTVVITDHDCRHEKFVTTITLNSAFHYIYTSTKSTIIEHMNYQRIEPGLLSVFRYFLGIQLALQTLNLCGSEGKPTAPYNFLLVLTTAGLLLYLKMDWFERYFRQYYLAIALLIATLMPLISFYGGLAIQLRNNSISDTATSESGLVIIWLFVPLLLWAAQYGLRSVIIFCLVTAIFNLSFAYALDVAGGPSTDLVFELVFVSVILYGVVGYVVVRLVDAQRKQRIALAEANTMLAQLATTQEQLVVSQERNRMARELHDTLAHTLSAVAVQLKALAIQMKSDSDAAENTLVRIQNLTSEGLQETRRALQSLRSNPIEDLGLDLALRNLATTTAERGGLELDLDITIPTPSLSSEIQLNLYRIAEEALENVLRHANAKSLSVGLKTFDGGVELRIMDNGVGFDPTLELPQGHFGIIGMRERAILCGAELTVESKPNVGTTLILKTMDKF